VSGDLRPRCRCAAVRRKATSGKGGEAVRGREWTAEERDQRRQLNAAKGLGRNLVTGYRGEWWAAEDIALFGTVPDEEVARRTGRTVGAVRQKREDLGIPNRAGNRWPAEHVALPGTLPDQDVARRLGRSLQPVTQKRCQLGIANPFDGRRQSKTGTPTAC
jgi:hypothetical protein